MVTRHTGLNNRELKLPHIVTSSMFRCNMTTITADTFRQATQPAVMNFNGTWKVYSDENLEDFLKATGRNIFIFRHMYIYFFM